MKVRERGYTEWEEASKYSIFNSEDVIAEDYARYCFLMASISPCDVDKFEMKIEVLNDEKEIKVFSVTARVDINFYPEEIGEGND